MSFDIIAQSDGLRTVANIPVATVGENWLTADGPLTVTQGDLESAVNALQDPSIKLPRIKLGHLDPRFTPDDTVDPSMTVEGFGFIFDGTPVLGKFDNLRMSADHQTLYADAIGVPEWFATIMPYAYPNRSMEGYWGVTTQTGHKHDFVITAVSLLGDEYPAIETLDDLQTMFTAEGPDWVGDLEFDTKRVAASKGGKMPQGRKLAASTSVEDVRRAMFEDFFTEESGRYWWWIRAVYADPQIIICADESDDLYAVSYSIGNDDVTFGDPVNVFTQYVETDGGKVAASTVMAKPAVATFSKAGGSRPKQTTTKEDNMPRTIHASVDVPALRSRLGLTAEQLPDDASDEQINEALANVTASPDPNQSPPPPDAPEPGTPEAGAPAPGEPTEGGADRGVVGPGDGGVNASSGTRQVDDAAFSQMQEDARLGREARQEQINARRTGKVKDAIKAGKIPPARLKHYMTLMSTDEEGTTAVLDSLEAGVIPVDEVGSSNTDEAMDASNYPEEWLSPTERARINAAREGKPLQTRVISEAT